MADCNVENNVSNERGLGRHASLLVSLFMALMIFATTHADRAWAEVLSVVSLDIAGAPSVATLVRDDVAGKNHVYVHAGSGNLIKRLQFFTFSNSGAPLLQAVAPDIDSSGYPEIAVLGVHPVDGDIRVQLKDAYSGAQIQTISFDGNYSPVGMAVVDIGGAPAIAMLGVGVSGSIIDGQVRILVKDALSGDWIRTLGLDMNFTPVAIALVPDMDNSGADEIAVLGVKNGEPNIGNVKVVIRDVYSKATIGEAIYFDKNYPPVALEVVPDFNGNGAPEIAILGVAGDGTVKVFIKDASTRSLVGQISYPTDFSPVSMAVVPDFDDGSGALNGASEIAVLGFSSDGKAKVIIKDADNGNWIKTPGLGSDFSPVSVAVMPDFDDGNGAPNGTSEIASLGAFADGRGKVSIQDASTAKLIKSVLVPPDCNDFVPNSPPAGAKNIVLIYTDDQRWDNLWAEAMPTIEGLKVNGVEFTNAFVTNPWCCPSRATLFSGGFYSHNTGVLSVGAPNGDAWKFFDTTTIATVLQQNGYKTAIMGKYINGYPSIDDPHGDEFYYIPPGWDWFRNTNVWKSNNEGGPDWFNFRAYSGDSCGEEHGHGAKTEISEPGVSYVTYYQRDEALDFLGTIVPDEPFFLMFSTHAPHEPADAPEDGGLKGAGVTNDYPYEIGPPRVEYPPFISTFCWRNSVRTYYLDCNDTGDDWAEDLNKPWYVENYSAKNWLVPDSNDSENRTIQEKTDDMNRKMLNSLWQTDNAVRVIMEKVADMGVLDNTVFIFTSDNGYLWGEHRLTAKQKPYEESIRIPLIIKVPNGGPTAQSTELVAMDTDLPQTILELALGVDVNGNSFLPSDGKSLLPIVTGSGGWTSRSELFFESFESGQRKNRFPPTWTAIRTNGTAGWLPTGTDTTGWPNGWDGHEWKYVEYVTGEKELYNLTTDSNEEENRYSVTGYEGMVMALSERLAGFRGIAIRTDNLDEPGKNLFLPEGKENMAYNDFQFSAWGGTGTYAWSIDMTTRKCTDADNQGDINNNINNGLPPSLENNLSSGGLLSGAQLTAGDVGTWEACIKVEDSSVSPQHGGPQSYTKRLRIVVSP